MSHGWSGHDSDAQIPLQDHPVAPAGFDSARSAGGYDSGYPPRQAPAHMTADQIWASEAGKEWHPSGPTAPAVEPRGRKWLWWLVGIAAVIIVAVAVAVPTAVVLSNKNKSSSAGSGGSSAGTNGTVSDSSDPSQFTTDSRLHNVFWGMAYDPEGSIVPNCGATQANVTRDIQILSQLTTRLRLYSSNCNILDLIMNAIQETKVNITITPAIYLNQAQDEYFDWQLGNITAAIDKYGTDMIDGIAVGNEFLLNALAASNLDATNSGTEYTAAVASLAESIQQVNSTILAKGLDKHIPIGTGDAGACMSVALGEEVDFFMANVHPWFGQLPIDQAAGWTWDFFQQNDVVYSTQSSNRPAMYIAETGWPSESMWTNSSNDGAGSPQGDASTANLQTFLDTFVCTANANATVYYYFEPFDEPWKAIYGGVEPYWGLFDSERNLKDITIPTCT